MPTLPEQLAADLLVARKARDAAATNALRTTLAALANAEAPPAPERSSSAPPVVGLVEHERLTLDAADHQRILREQIAVRVEAAAEYDAIGQAEAAATRPRRDRRRSSPTSPAPEPRSPIAAPRDDGTGDGDERARVEVDVGPVGVVDTDARRARRRS